MKVSHINISKAKSFENVIQSKYIVRHNKIMAYFNKIQTKFNKIQTKISNTSNSILEKLNKGV